MTHQWWLSPWILAEDSPWFFWGLQRIFCLAISLNKCPTNWWLVAAWRGKPIFRRWYFTTATGHFCKQQKMYKWICVRTRDVQYKLVLYKKSTNKWDCIRTRTEKIGNTQLQIIGFWTNFWISLWVTGGKLEVFVMHIQYLEQGFLLCISEPIFCLLDEDDSLIKVFYCRHWWQQRPVANIKLEPIQV